jgi:iron complex outermembrane receptor protein
MKKIMGTTAFLLLAILIAAQSSKTIKGVVIDQTTKSPISGAIISCGKQQVISNESGNFVLSKTDNASISISSMGYKSFVSTINTTNNNELEFALIPNPSYLQPLEVNAIRASDKSPFTKTNILKADIAKQNLAQDIPFLLNQTPSVVINSDAGNGVGYTAMRIRGTDATRINVTLNGIPYNDAESMGTFFVNLPDFSSSVNSIQIQRGVGTSSNGAGAFGATLNLSTNEYNEKSYAEINNSIGSFNTYKNTLKFGSGLIGKHFMIDARLSSIRSDGYIDRAASNLKSFYFSSAYINKKSSLRLNVFSGHEKTYQAWYGIDAATLVSNRTFNPAGTEKIGTPYDNQTDNYTQTHYQLFFNHSINEKWSFNTALFYTKGKGYYEEYKADQSFSKYGLSNVIIGGTTYTKTNLVRQRWLDNDFYGQIFSFQYKTIKDEITIGGGWNKYLGDHFGTLAWMERGTIPPNYRYYFYPADKSDLNAYAKWQHQLARHLTGFADLQFRSVKHNIYGFQNNQTLNINKQFNFVNPKIGISYIKNGWHNYLSFAVANKEPNRDDFEAGIISTPKHETLNDWELGIEKRGKNFTAGATFYYMDYKNQLVLTGQINDVGAYTRTNIPASYRMGIELQASAKLASWFNLAGNLTLSKNKIKSFTEYIDNYDNGLQNKVQHQNKDIAFSANTISSLTLNFIPLKNGEISLLNKYVGKQYLDNTQNENRMLKAFMTQDLRAMYTLRNKLPKEVQFIFQVNNVFNKMYEPNGYTFSYIAGGTQTTENYFYPMAGTNFMIAVNVKF